MKKKTVVAILMLTVLLGSAIAYGITSSEKAILYPAVETRVVEEDPSKVKDPLWYTDNTVGVIGISLRDAYPDLTSNWYNVVPVDLSQDGEQVFPLVASNLYYLGNATVSVSGDEVTVTYEYPQYYHKYQIYGKSETLAWFTSIEEITHDFLENPASDLAFGTAVSKKQDLNGQDYALLFICNRLSYRLPLNGDGAMPTRYWPNQPRMADYFATAATLAEKVEANHAEKLAEQEEAAQAEQTETETTEPAEQEAAAETAEPAEQEAAAETAESAEQEAAAEPAAESEAEAEPAAEEEEVVAVLPEEGWVLDAVNGAVWQDDRASLEVFLEDVDNYKVQISWGSSASETTEWVYACDYDAETQTLKARNVVCDHVVTDEAGEENRTEVYEKDESEAYFALNEEGQLVIYQAGDEQLEGKTFTRVPE